MDQATNTTEDIPEEFQYKEAEIDENDKKLLGVQDVTSAFMMASEMGKKFNSNQTVVSVVTVLDENEEEAEEDSEGSEETRPGSGILQETLQEIANQEHQPEEEPNQESEEGEEEEDDDEEDEESNE